MVNLYSHLDDTFIEFSSKKEMDEYIIEEYNDDLTHLEIIQEYIGIYCLYDSDSKEYL